MSTEKKIDTDSLCYYITQKVKNVRFELNSTQAEFAEKTGVAKSLIEKYERRVHSIPPKTLEEMAKKLSKDIENFFPESTNCISSEDKKSFDLVQTLKRIKDWKARDAVCVLTRFLSEGIQISKFTEEIRPISYQMVQKAKDWRFARGRTQVEVADKSGMPHGQVVRYEKGEVSFKIVPKMADGLSLHYGVLLPTSKAERYCEDEDGEGEKKILSIMREYQKIDNQKLKAVVLKVNRKIDVAVNKYLKFVWAYLFTATLLLYRSSLRTIFLSKDPIIFDQRVSKNKQFSHSSSGSNFIWLFILTI